MRHKDETTGATAVLTRMQTSIPAHRHTKADESVCVLEGDFVEGGASYGCVVLTHFSAELDFQLV